MKRRGFDESDQIRLNLERIEAESGKQPVWEKMFSSTPIVPFTIAFILGIVFYESVKTFGILTAITGLFILFSGTALPFFRIDIPKTLKFIFVAGVLLFFLAGFLRIWQAYYIPPNHIRHLLKGERELATIQGTVISNVHVNQSGQSFSSIPWLDERSSFYVKADQVNTADGWKNICGTVRVQVSEPVYHVQSGNTVRVYCWLSEFSPPANPGQFDMLTYMKRRAVHVSASVSISEGIEILDASSSLMARFGTRLYHWACRTLLDESVHDSDVRSLTAALLLGRRDSMNPSITAAFRKTGLAHFISLSGMHVGILAGTLWKLLRTAGLHKRPRAILCMILILIYALIVPPRAPTMRAVFLSCFFFTSVLIRQDINPLNTLALSAVVLLFFRPFELFSAGWQLSFACVLGILIFYKPLLYYLLTYCFYPLLPFLQKHLKWMLNPYHNILQLLSVGIAAWLAGAGIMLYHFGTITPLAPLWTVMAFPFVFVILCAGFAKIVFTAFLPTLASLMGVVLTYVTQSLEMMIGLMAKIDFFQFTMPRQSLFIILFIYIMLLMIRYLPYRYQRFRHTAIIGCLLCLAAPILSGFLRSHDHAEITCLSVGHGQAIIVKSPANEYFLFDAGSITHQNISDKCLLPYFRYSGISSLSGVYLSHGDLDHINAVPEMAASITVEKIYANSDLLQTAENYSLEKQLKDRLKHLKIQLEQIVNYHEDDTFAIESLWPNPQAAVNPSVSENDKSEVFLIRCNGRNILLCGDIETWAQNQIRQLYPALKVDVLVMPHHGSTVNLQTEFIHHFSPQTLIISCAGNRAPKTYHPADQSEMKAFYTPTDGAITIKIKADGTISADGFLKSSK